MSCTRSSMAMVVFTLLSLGSGIGIFSTISVITFTDTHWQTHSISRKIFRILVTSSHYIILPTTSVIMMWLIYPEQGEKGDTNGCGNKSQFRCSVFREVDELESVEIPKIDASSKKNNEGKTGNTDVIKNPAFIGNNAQKEKKKCRNIGRMFLILLNVIIPVCYLMSGILQSFGAGRELFNDKGRQGTVNYTDNDILKTRIYSGFTIGFYSLNCLLIISALIYTINVYLNAMYRSAWLEKSLREKYRSEMKEVIVNILRFFQSPNDELQRNLCWANIFSSVYIINVILFGGGYILYIFSHNLAHDPVRWGIVGTLGLSGFLLLLIIVVTNSHIEDLKSSTLLMINIKQVEKLGLINTTDQGTPKSKETTSEPNDQSSVSYDLVQLETIMNHFNPYATVCGYAPQFITIVGMALVQAATLVVPAILTEHGIIKPDKLTNPNLSVF